MSGGEAGMSGADLLAVVQRYYDGCNLADEALMMSTFDPGVVHYFTHHAPVRGAAALARYWSTMQPKIAGHWTLDHGLASGDEAVIEWTLRWTPPGEQEVLLMRGSEWYRFEDARIAEIRAYYANPRAALPSGNDFELLGFPYPARGFPVR